MKPPDAQRPSGDRTIARLLLRAMAIGGHEATVASDVRSYMAAPTDRGRLEQIERQAADDAGRLTETLSLNPPDLWFTYHLFHKAPDLVGPPVCRALGLPYAIAEASFAPKRAAGPWAARHAQVRDALGLADHIFFLNPADEACVLPQLKTGATHSRLPALVTVPADREPKGRDVYRRRLAREWRLREEAVWILAVGMMRPGDKLASFTLLAETWEKCADLPAHLLIVGDGPARADVQRRFASCADRVSFLGMLDRGKLDSVYNAVDFFFWPGTNEAVGMALLEAMAAGLPVATGPWGSVAREIEQGVTGMVAMKVCDFADAVGRLVADPDLRRTMGAAARKHVLRHHSLSVAANSLTAAFDDVAGRTGADYAGASRAGRGRIGAGRIA
ncbi:MAG: glycosyltransferase family 4 protein [Rhodospirillaceae bacterium]|nr:glycosyltransferase family 4 protein [Rhodospirillaceae bacterium]